MQIKDDNIERKRLLLNLVPPFLLLIVLWFVKFIEFTFDISFVHNGIDPMHLKGLQGILFSPFIHGSFEHLYHNSVPLLVLGWALFYFYHRISWKVFFMIWLFSGIGTWIFGRPSYHIGASGVIYGLFAFLFFSGVFRKNIRLMALSMLVIFLYGSMVWGVFPGFSPEKNISWEGHSAGAIAGFALALVFRKEKAFEEEEEIPEEEDESEEEFFLYRAMPVKNPMKRTRPIIRVKNINLNALSAPHKQEAKKRKIVVTYSAKPKS